MLLLPVSSCSVKKNNFLSRSYHKTLAHYNGYFNAREKVKEGAKQLFDGQKDQYDRILSIFKYGDKNSAKAVNPTMDEAIKKVSLVIQRHSMDIEGTERNRWIPQSYLIIGLAQFYKHETWTAIESFQYISAQYRNDPVKYEALLWLVQCYLRLGKTPDAEFLLSTLRDDPKMPVRLKPFFHAVYADYFLLMNDYEQAVEKLEVAAVTSKKRSDRVRYHFITGQIYQKLGEYNRAVDKYNIVIKSKPAYEMDFNARINRALCIDVNSPDGKDIKRILTRMLSDEKNLEYHDQIYYALAEVALKENNTPEAIELLKKSTASSVSNDNQKAISYLKLADIYFKQPEYLLAQTYYDSTVAFLTKDHPDYPTIINTHENLTKLIQNLKVIMAEDSLQTLAAKSPSEREAFVDGLIKKENEEREKAEQEKREREKEEQESKTENEGDPFFNAQQGGRPAPGGQQGGGWYFSNQSAVSFGFNEFIRIWGNRKLEDNWRRSNRATFIESAPGGDEELAALDSAALLGQAVRDSVLQALNAKKKKAYLDSIPATAEQKARSDAKIVEAYYNVGLIYKEQLRDNKAAGSSFETLMQRYPDNQYKIPTYYNLYRVYLTLGNEEKSDYYKNIILKDYPDTEYAKIILNPDYFKDQQKKVAIQKVFYENTYRAYLNKQYADVIERKEMADSLFPGSELAPKFELLKALAIGRLRPVAEFEVSLKGVVAKYPADTVATKAKEILAKINPSMYQQPKDTLKSGSAATPEVVQPAKPKTPYRVNADTLQYVIMVFPNNNVVGSNELKVAVSNYNTKFYSVKKLQISNSFLGTEYQFLMIRQFTDKEDALAYLDGLLSDEEAFQGIDLPTVRSVVITPDNLLLLMQSKDVDEYEFFYGENYLNN